MRGRGAVLAAHGQLEMGARAGHFEKDAVVAVVAGEAADLGEAQAIPVEAHERVQALGVTGDPQLHGLTLGNGAGRRGKVCCRQASGVGMTENLELVRSILIEWERGDFRSVDWADPQIEYAILDEPGARFGRGVPAMRGMWREFLTAWEDYRVVAHEYRELDGERVLVALRARGRGKTSGIDLDATAGGRGSANLFQLRRGKVTRLVSYFDRDQALADARADPAAPAAARRRGGAGPPHGRPRIPPPLSGLRA